jgi:hypothetical protein
VARVRVVAGLRPALLFVGHGAAVYHARALRAKNAAVLRGTSGPRRNALALSALSFLAFATFEAAADLRPALSGAAASSRAKVAAP